MKTIGVFYGSSTGNTELAAEMIAISLGSLFLIQLILVNPNQQIYLLMTFCC